ncbi:MAG TPA: ribosome small subunit-dependent GTPase A [Aquabacterium sp.]|nr:ribosome small subunit-dependent GTPase A [Aquabacterium sp.]HQC94365.1 ribosome small subunit-dependent GTPase A [Aquabacterium sp.]
MTASIDFPALLKIGLGDTLRLRLAAGVADPLARPMRLVEVQRDHWLLHDGRQLHRARCDSALAADLQAQDETLAVGDWLLARPDDAGACGTTCRITCRLPPVNQLARRVHGGGRLARGAGQRQVLVRNIDTALLVMGLDGDFQPRRLERYLGLLQGAGVAAVLVLSKADTVAPDRVVQRQAEAAALLPPRMPVLALDTRLPSTAAVLSGWLQPGRTLVLLGSSGAGKSTLANTLLSAGGPAGDRATGAVRTDDSRGRHTTTVRSLLPLPGGACVIDTPGLRALRLDLDDAAPLAEVFADVARLAPLCRFRDCRHLQEPGCAVRHGVDAHRLANYHKLLREGAPAGPGPQRPAPPAAAVLQRQRRALAKAWGKRAARP